MKVGIRKVGGMIRGIAVNSRREIFTHDTAEIPINEVREFMILWLTFEISHGGLTPLAVATGSALS
jgi:hypothetical protein